MMEYTIKDKPTLDRLRQDRTLKLGLRAIKIEVGGSADVKSCERKLNRYYFACGCTAGQIAVMCSLVMLGLLWLVDKDSGLLTWWRVVAGIFASALVGKIAGLVVSHYLLRRTYSRLEKLLT
jgi:hypothetical protein